MSATSCAADGTPIFNPLDHGIHGQPLMVSASAYNAARGQAELLKCLLRESLVKFEDYADQHLIREPRNLTRRIREAVGAPNEIPTAKESE